MAAAIDGNKLAAGLAPDFTPNRAHLLAQIEELTDDLDNANADLNHANREIEELRERIEHLTLARDNAMGIAYLASANDRTITRVHIDNEGRYQEPCEVLKVAGTDQLLRTLERILNASVPPRPLDLPPADVHYLGRLCKAVRASKERIERHVKPPVLWEVL